MRRLFAIFCAGYASIGNAELMPAPEAEVSIIGRACIDSEGEGRCKAGSPPAPGLIVRAGGGLESLTDEAGRFHMSALPSRTRVLLPGDQPFARLSHLPLTIDVGPLGPKARAPEVVWIDLVPGSTVSVELAIHLPEAAATPAPVSGPDTGRVPAIELMEEGLRFHVPINLPAEHEVLMDGRTISPGAEGERMLPVPLGAREGEALVLDRAPDGRVRVLRQVVLRVPRPRGGDLFAPRALEELATLDLPAHSESVRPGPLRVPIHGEPGAEVRLGDSSPVTIGESGEAISSIVFPDDGRLTIFVTTAGGVEAVAEVVLEVDESRTKSRLLAADLRVGMVDGGGLFGEGMISGVGEWRLFGGALTGGIELRDDDLERISSGGALLSMRRPQQMVSGLDPFVQGSVFGDDSVQLHKDPMGLGAWASWESNAGFARFGAVRTGLAEAEVGRFDRPTVGTKMDLSASMGVVDLRLQGGADASGLGIMEASPLLLARAELRGTGGAVYHLAHREIVAGSEKVWIERRDPRTGLVVDRSLMRRMVDYELHPSSGRLIMSRPVGSWSRAPAGSLGADAIGYDSVIVVDYAHIASLGHEVDTGHGAARLSVAALGVEVGLRGALSWLGSGLGEREGIGQDFSLAGVDLLAEPWEWLSVAASLARSEGDAFGIGASLARSRDGGFSFHSPVPLLEHEGIDSEGERAADGLASSLRVRLGNEDSSISGWWADRSDWYSDGAMPMEGSGRQIGAMGRTRLLGAELSVLADRWEGNHPWRDRRERASLLTGRVERRFGPVSLAAEALHRSGASLEDPREDSWVEGAAGATGAELIWHATDDLDLSIGHLQAIAFEGDHPSGRDPTFSSVGMQLRRPGLGEIGLRGGVNRDLEPSLSASWNRQIPEQESVSYGSLGLGASVAMQESAASSVSGARREHSPGMATFVEHRVLDDHAGTREGKAVGTEISEGPWSATLSYERGEDLDVAAGPRLLRDGLYASVSLRLPILRIRAFGESVRATSAQPTLETVPGPEEAPRSLRWWHAGLFAHLRASESLSIGGGVIAGQASGPAGRVLLPEGGLDVEGFVGAAWRPDTASPMSPAVLLHYGIRQRGLLPSDSLALLPAYRRHLVRAGLSLGALPGPQARLSATGATYEIVAGELEGLATRQGVLSFRLGWPVGPVEPALEIGARAVAGAELPFEIEPTLRTELAVVLGPASVGVGGVLAGFTGSGIEEPGQVGDSSRVYLVVRGAVQ